MFQYATLEDTVYFGFASNLTTGAAGDGATPLYDVRLAGAAAGAAPVLSGTPTLLTNASYSDGLHEVSIAATAVNGFAANNTYLVYVTLTIDSVTPASCIGGFRLAPIPSNTTQWLGTAVATPTVAGVPEVDVTHLNGVAQSLLDLKDFADDGYDPATNKVQGLVLADAVTGLTAANLDVAVSTRLAAAAYTAPDNASISAILTDTGTDIPATLATLATAANLATVDTVVDAIKVKTDSINFTVAGQVDSNIQYVNDVLVAGTGAPGNEWGP